MHNHHESVRQTDLDQELDLIAAFVHYSAELARFVRLRKGGVYSFGEYLTQGMLRIEGKSYSIPLHKLWLEGLVQLRPEFDEALNSQYPG